jgi:dihydroxy-acid dehydratase
MELAKTASIKDPQVITPRRVYAKQSGLGVLKGNLAPNGALFLLNQVSAELMTFRGTAMVFESEGEATNALNQGKIKKGTAIVVRGLGPRGGPGLHKLRVLPTLLEIKGLSNVFPVITDGRLPDAPKGLFISLVSPEGMAKGALAVVRDGDQIDIDVQLRSFLVRLTDTEMNVRMARWQAPVTATKRGFLDRYSRSVSDVHEGAVLK